MSSTNDDTFDDNELHLVQDSWEKGENFLQEIPFFNQLGDEKIKGIAEKLQIKRYYGGGILLHENEIGNLFYIVAQGQANCYTESDCSHVPMAVLKCGDFFGGKDLFNNLTSVATVAAEDNLMCFTLTKMCTMTRHDFEKELTPVANKLQQAANQYRVFIDKQI